jgi:hypothetical protein
LLTVLCNRDIFVGGALPFGVVKVGIDTIHRLRDLGRRMESWCTIHSLLLWRFRYTTG